MVTNIHNPNHQQDADLHVRVSIALTLRQRSPLREIVLEVADGVVHGIRGVVDQMTIAGAGSPSSPATIGRSIKTAAAWFVLAAVAVLAGCNSSEPALNPVQGQIIVNGQPLANAQVVLRSEDPA